MAKAPPEYSRKRSATSPNYQAAAALSYDGRSVPKLSCLRFGRGVYNVLSIARRYGIPIEHNSELTRKLKSLSEDDAIPTDLFEDVAGVLAGVVPPNSD